HSMAKVLAVSGNFKAAVMAERDAHRFFSATFGDDDPRSKETSEWLTELTINAVKTAKLSKATKEKIMESANLLRVDHESTAAATTSAAGAGAGASATPSSKGHLSIDELIQFINSNSSKSKPRGGPRGKGGPKGSHR
ncbi:Intracellular distribution of mitochondria, partial [Coemansia sp. RSA 2681]